MPRTLKPGARASLSLVLALVASLMLFSAPVATPAVATPNLGQKTKKFTRNNPESYLSGKRHSMLSVAQYINLKATGPKRISLDYKLADKYDKGQISTRREFVAGWLLTGKKVNNISRSERAKV